MIKLILNVITPVEEDDDLVFYLQNTDCFSELLKTTKLQLEGYKKVSDDVWYCSEHYRAPVEIGARLYKLQEYGGSNKSNFLLAKCGKGSTRSVALFKRVPYSDGLRKYRFVDWLI